MPDLDTIALTNPVASAVLRHSALKFCTTWTDDTVTRNWPSLSSGEAVLWDVLAYINGVGERPSDLTVSAELDPMNALIAAEALRYFEAEVSA